ncbi:general stress protein 26 [Catenulispora sp. GP43]|uniref:pyridoxamine 5'-phosphate oxidase family protein n=1 Tax=Catenulispora sp. GP43 TaxID=3156263 RepID=UPI0035122042
MAEPVTTLVSRFSAPQATATDWAITRQAVEGSELFWLTTVRADGRPHVTPVVAVWFDDALWFCTGAHEQKFANLGGNEHVVLTTGCNGWDGGLDVVVEGQAVQVGDETVLKAVAEAYTSRWDGRWQYSVAEGRFHNPQAGGGEALVFRVAPVKVFAYAKGDPFGATRHLFG